MSTKRLTRQARVGQTGINVIERVALTMGAKWSPNISNDVGIDGSLEFFDPATGRALGYVVAVQSKVNTGRLPAESEGSFDWAVKEADLDYWLGLNLPVLLVIVRPPDEAYWIPVREAYGSPQQRRKRRTTVSKKDQSFSSTAANRILGAIAPPTLSALVQPRIPETLASNLLAVTPPERLWVGDAPFERGRDLSDALRQQGCRDGAWLLHGRRIVTFHDLREHPWSMLVDQGSVDDFATAEWAQADDADLGRTFTWLLNETVRFQLAPDVRFWKEEGVYAFHAGQPTLLAGDLLDWRIVDPGTGRRRLVFSSWRAKRDSHRIAYRHLGAVLSFLRLEGRWYLTVVPTYIFTTNGWTVSRYHPAGTAAMKRLERNETVRGQTRFWANYLRREPDLMPTPAPLAFDEPLEFIVDGGVDDEAWLRRNPASEDVGTLWSDLADE